MNLLSVIAASRRRGGLFDADAADYFTRIVTAGSTISEANKTAVNAFVVGCKADGIWSAIKASCILAGADTLAGAMVPLVGPAPTNEGPFVEGDYSRTTGLVTTGGSKHIGTGYNNASSPEGNLHFVAYQTATFDNALGGTRRGVNGSTTLFNTGQCRTQNSNVLSSATFVNGLVGHTRSESAVTLRTGGVNYARTQAPQTPYSENIHLFRLNGGDLSSNTGGMSFYSIGESLDLAQLDARLATLIGALT